MTINKKERYQGTREVPRGKLLETIASFETRKVIPFNEIFITNPYVHEVPFYRSYLDEERGKFVPVTIARVDFEYLRTDLDEIQKGQEFKLRSLAFLLGVDMGSFSQLERSLYFRVKWWLGGEKFRAEDVWDKLEPFIKRRFNLLPPKVREFVLYSLPFQDITWDKREWGLAKIASENCMGVAVPIGNEVKFTFPLAPFIHRDWWTDYIRRVMKAARKNHGLIAEPSAVEKAKEIVGSERGVFLPGAVMVNVKNLDAIGVPKELRGRPLISYSGEPNQIGEEYVPILHPKIGLPEEIYNESLDTNLEEATINWIRRDSSTTAGRFF